MNGEKDGSGSGKGWRVGWSGVEPKRELKGRKDQLNQQKKKEKERKSIGWEWMEDDEPKNEERNAETHLHLLALAFAVWPSFVLAFVSGLLSGLSSRGWEGLHTQSQVSTNTTDTLNSQLSTQPTLTNNGERVSKKKKKRV